jgi:cell division protease FtsH
VTQWGMSSRMGPRTFGRRQSMVFLGRDISEERDYSDRTAEEIDDEVRRMIDEAHEVCRQVLTQHRDKLEELAARLIEVETVEGEELIRLLGPAEGRQLPEELADASPLAPPPSPKDGSDETPSEEDEEEEAPQGRPGLAWGRSNVVPPQQSGSE